MVPCVTSTPQTWAKAVPTNAFVSILVTESGIVMLVRAAQFLKCSSAILVCPSGIVI